MSVTKEKMMERCASMIDSYQEDKKEWMIKFENDSLYQLEWADKLFTIVAKQKVYQNLLKSLETEESTIETALIVLKSKMKNMAMYPQNSTSQCSNICHREVLSAIANIIEEME